MGRLSARAEASVQPSCKHLLSSDYAQGNGLQGLHCTGAEVEELAPICRKWKVSGGGGAVQEEVSRAEAGGFHRRKGHPDLGNLGELPPGGTQV